MATPKITIDFDADALLRVIDAGARRGLVFAQDLLLNKMRDAAPKQTGALAESHFAGDPFGDLLSDTLTGEVGARAAYAAYVEYGTGEFGPNGKGWWVEPQSAEALRFPAPGGAGWIFSAGHYMPGAKPNPWFVPTIEDNLERVAQTIGDFIDFALEDFE